MPSSTISFYFCPLCLRRNRLGLTLLYFPKARVRAVASEYPRSLAISPMERSVLNSSRSATPKRMSAMIPEIVVLCFDRRLFKTLTVKPQASAAVTAVTLSALNCAQIASLTDVRKSTGSTEVPPGAGVCAGTSAPSGNAWVSQSAGKRIEKPWGSHRIGRTPWNSSGRAFGSATCTIRIDGSQRKSRVRCSNPSQMATMKASTCAGDVEG